MKRFKKLSALLLAAVMLVSLIPGNVVRADGSWYISFSENQNSLKETAENPSKDGEEISESSKAFINPTSALGRFAQTRGIDYPYAWASEYYFDVSGEYPSVAIIEDNQKYTGLNFIDSNIDPKSVDEVKYIFSSVDLTDFSYDEDWDEIWCEETVYEAVSLAPHEMIDMRAAMPEYNNKNDVFLIEVQTWANDELIDWGIFGLLVFRSQLEGHAGKLVEDISGEDSNEIYRVRNPKNNEHLLTSSPDEVVSLQLKGWERENSMGIGVDADDSNAVPVYRLFNSKNGEHLFTSSIDEINSLTANKNWTKDNDGDPLFYGSSEGTVAVYRLFNPRGKGPSAHLVTSDTNEIKYLTTEKGYTYDNNGEPIFYIP